MLKMLVKRFNKGASMDNIVGKKSSLSWAVNISVTVLVILWLIPTIGLLVSSFRTADQISTSGWWKAFNSNEQNIIVRTANPQTQKIIDGKYVIEGMLFNSGKRNDH
jgi:maltose ABC transporter membrane protein/trehalose ABC transporter membrane protein/sucrose ABC transporter membrane protein